MGLQRLSIRVGHGCDERLAVICERDRGLIRFRELTQPPLSVVGVRQGDSNARTETCYNIREAAVSVGERQRAGGWVSNRNKTIGTIVRELGRVAVWVGDGRQ